MTTQRYHAYSGHCFGAWAVACCILLAAMAACVRADDVAPPQGTQPGLADLGLEELMNIEVVSASKKLQKLSETPAAVFVITRDDIRRYGYRNLAEALQRVIGMYVGSDRTYSYLGVRGFARPGDCNTRILLLLDGHRINNAMFDTAMLGEDLSLDIESIERIEVVKGPGSALWGTNALLAVINVITRKGSDSDTRRTIVEYGTHARRKALIEFGNVSDSGLEVCGSFSGLDSNGQGHIYFPEFDNPATNYGVAEGMDDERATRGYVSASYKGLTFLFNEGKQRKVIPTAPYGAVFNKDGTCTAEEREFAELSYERDVLRRHNGKLLFRLYQDEHEYNGDFIFDIGAPTLATFKGYTLSKWWGGEARYSQDISPRLSVICGLEYQKSTDMRALAYIDVPYYVLSQDLDSSFELSSYYLQADFGLSDSLRLVAGTRLDDCSTFGKAWSPRAALIYSPSSSTALKLLYGEAFRAPNEYERNYSSDFFRPGNTGLRPEEIATTEIIWEQRVGRGSRLVTSLFHYRLNDLITQVRTPEGIVHFENVGAVTSDGMEIQIESRLANGLTSYFGLTGLHARDANGQPISNSPRFMAVGGVSIPLRSNKVYLTPEVQYIGRRKTLSGGDVHSWAVANLTIEARNISKDLDMAFSIYNLFDEEVFAPGGTEHVQDQLPQDRRTFRFQLTRRF